MNRLKTVLLAAMALGAAAASTGAEAHGWGHGPRFSLGINLGFPGYYSGYYPGYYPAYYPAYAPAPTVVYQSAPVMVAPPPSQVVYQYYCAPAQAYYPAVQTCTQPWLKVVPDGSAGY